MVSKIFWLSIRIHKFKSLFFLDVVAEEVRLVNVSEDGKVVTRALVEPWSVPSNFNQTSMAAATTPHTSLGTQDTVPGVTRVVTTASVHAADTDTTDNIFPKARGSAEDPEDYADAIEYHNSGDHEPNSTDYESHGEYDPFATDGGTVGNQAGPGNDVEIQIRGSGGGNCRCYFKLDSLRNKFCGVKSGILNPTYAGYEMVKRDSGNTNENNER